MNLVFNKPLLDNAAKVFDIFLRPTHRSSETTVTVYTDAINGLTTTTVQSQYILFVPASMMTILDKINTAYWNETFSLVNDSEKVKILVNTILNGTESQRNSALDKLVSMGIIASGDTTMVRSLVSRIPSFDPELMVRSYDQAGGFYKYSYNIPLGLEKKYDQVRNTSNEKLFLLFNGRGHSQFGYSTVTGETYGYFTKYWDEMFQKDSFVMSYMAVDLGDIMSPDVDAIKYDHLDVVEYFDNIIIQLQIPNSYN